MYFKPHNATHTLMSTQVASQSVAGKQTWLGKDEVLHFHEDSQKNIWVTCSLDLKFTFWSII